MADSGGPEEDYAVTFHLEAQDRAFRRLVQPVLLWGLREKTLPRNLQLGLLQSLWAGCGTSGGEDSEG